MKFAHCLHIVLAIGNYTDVFGGYFCLARGVGGEGYVGEYFHGGIFHRGREFSMKGAPDLPGLFEKRSKVK